jgi:LPXTG-site transpeptidase (sortase) family protein
MGHIRAGVTIGKPAVWFRLFPFVLSVTLLACGEGGLSSSRDSRASGAATITAWAREGTLFPELNVLATTSIPSTAIAEPVAAEPSASVPSTSDAALLTTAAAPQAQATMASVEASTPPSLARSATPRPIPNAQEPIGRIAIPTLGIDVPVAQVSWHLDQIDGQAVAIWDTIPGSAGHHRGTAAPGAKGNCIISGHSRAQDSGIFNGLWALEPGDIIRLANVQGDEFAYAVDRVEKVEELGQPLAQRLANASFMAPTQDAVLTLITCWPDWAYTHRVIVVARLR